MKETHEPIIDQKTFEFVEKLISSKSIRKQKNQKDKYLFRGLLKCHECGHNIIILKKKCKKTVLIILNATDIVKKKNMVFVKFIELIIIY